MKTRTVPKWAIDPDEIRRLARAGGWSVRQLAANAKLDETNFYKYLNGHRDMGLDEAAIVAFVLTLRLGHRVTVEDIAAKPCPRCGTVKAAAA